MTTSITQYHITSVTLALEKSEIGSQVFSEGEAEWGVKEGGILSLDTNSHCGREITHIIREGLKFETVLSEPQAIQKLWEGIYVECCVILHG